MELNRECGILLHPTSLPSPYGIGDLGHDAYDFIDFLAAGGQKLWQILPLNTVGYGDSPYATLSAFAGNPLLISPDKLVSAGLLDSADVKNKPAFDQAKVHFDQVRTYKDSLFRKAFQRFADLEDSAAYREFVNDNQYWLDDYCLFMALKNHFNGVPWNKWEKAIAAREEGAVRRYQEMLHREIDYYRFLQFIFYTQWHDLKQYAHIKGIKIIGDLPIYVSYDSSDTWSKPHYYQLDEKGLPLKVAGVPPDYFSETGQLWGNPIYNWEAMSADNFRWWKERFSNLYKLVDIIRIDHFRGFEAYWEVPFGEKTAINGRWVKAPGEQLFNALKEHLGPDGFAVIAEDLGIITPEVVKLKEQFNFPGMKVLQFAFESAAVEEFSPCYHEQNLVVYTGTHDNDTILGWYQKAAANHPKLKPLLKKYFGIDSTLTDQEICWRFIEIAYYSFANRVIIPLQDVLGLGSDARMNYPGTANGNWQWRFSKSSLTADTAAKLRDLAVLCNR